MATLFYRSFKYAECSGAYGADGRWVHGEALTRIVRGTVQAATSKECLMLSNGARNSGMVEVYSSERLESETRGRSEGGYVFFHGGFYRLESEAYFDHLFGGHWKYVGQLLPDSEVPPQIREALS